MSEISTEAVYKSDQDFKEYVDRFCRERHVLVTEALKYETVKEVAKYYLELSLEKIDGK